MSLKRKLLFGTLAALPLLAILAIFLISTPMIDRYQKSIDKDPDAESSRDRQLMLSDLCFKTWRYEQAASGYRRFYERYTRDVRRADALLRYAQSLEEAERNADAKDIYEKYLAEYPHLEGRTEAERGLVRISNVKR